MWTVAVLLALSAVARAAKAQEIAAVPTLELYGGYDYIRLNVKANVSVQPPSATYNLAMTWRDWEKETREGPLALVHAAILSSNAFNTQPWLFKVNSSRIEVHADTKRNLGAFDPYLREMSFRLGCALENLCLTAPSHELTASVSLLPAKLEPIPDQPKPELAAAVDLRVGPRISGELFDAIPRRHTNREPFDVKKEVSTEFVNSLANLARDDEDVRIFVFTQETDRKQIVDVIWDASKKLVSDPAVRAGMQAWSRTTMQQVQDDRDGTYVGPPVGKRGSPPLSYPDLMMTGRLFGIIAVHDRYDRPQTIRAGRIWQRAHLLATARGLAARPANGAVEFIDQERKLKMQPETLARLAKIAGGASWQPTFMFYMGYATVPATASARRSVQDVLLS